MNKFHIYLYGPLCGPIETSFENAASRLTRLEHLAFEPDGSFVYSRSRGEQQVFGMLFDAQARLRYAELRGHCDRETFQIVVLAICGNCEHDLTVMRLPMRQLQDLQSFEETTFC